MREFQKAIVFLSWFGSGILMPILSLLFLEKGCDLRTLPLAMSLYSATVIVCEVPTGVFADLFGRKRTYLVSCGLYLVDMLILLVADRFWMLLPAVVIFGLARAFSSGSLDALFVEDAMERLGPEHLSVATGQLSMYQSLGMALGALLGGALPLVGSYALHLWVRIAFLILPGALCAGLVREKKRHADGGTRPKLADHLHACGALLRDTPMLWGLLACFITMGGLVAFIETYWQPAFLAVAGAEMHPLLGVISALSFGAVTAGNLIIRRGKLAPETGEWRGYLALRALMVVTTVFFALQLGILGFVLGYGLIYLVMGGTDVLEQTLINRMAPDSQRASLLSVGSLTFQIGGLLASLFSAAAVGALGFRGVFLTGGLLLAVGTLIPIVLMARTRRAVR